VSAALLASVHTSQYQLFKLRILELVPVSKDAAHVYIGMTCLLFAFLLLRLPMRSFRALIPGVVVALMMEVFDLRDDLVSVGHPRWWASLHDLVNTNLLPLVLVTAARMGLIRK
jgi:hypothetical protein